MTKEEYLLPGDIFDALSSPIRLHILADLRVIPMNSSRLSSTMNMTMQALQRHVDGLIKAGLVIRDLDGVLNLSAVGEASLEQMSSFHFLSKHKNYFQEHTFSGIPRHLIQRIGELDNCEFLEDHMLAWQRAKDHVQSAEKFLYGMTTMPPNEFYIEAKKLLEKGVRFKILHSEDTVVAKGFSRIRQENGWIDAINDGHVEEQYVKHLPMTNVIIENAAEILFASKKTDLIDGGSMFYSKDPDFRSWCLELFNYYWNEVEKVNPPKLQEV